MRMTIHDIKLGDNLEVIKKNYVKIMTIYKCFDLK